jgi:hypothetical protein
MGDSGSGKTCLATSFPRPIYVADFDNKVESAALFHSDLTDIDYDKYTIQTCPEGPIHSIKKKFAEFAELQNKGKLPYKTIVLDSLTTFTDEAIRYLIKVNPGIKRVATQGAQAPVLQDYGLLRIFTKEFITWILDFDAHVVCTAHIGRERDEVTGKILNDPLLTGKLRHELPIWFHEVWRTFNDGNDYKVQVRADNNYNLRTQLKGIPGIVDSSFKALIPYMGASDNEQTSHTTKEEVVVSP